MTTKNSVEATIQPTTEKRAPSKPGTQSIFVSLSDANYAALIQSANGRRLNLWLSRLIERHFSTLVPPAGE